MTNKFGHNPWFVRIVAFLMACGLWIYVMGDQNPYTSRDFEISLGKVNLASNMEVTNLPERVKVKVTGPRLTIAGMTTNAIRAFVDFSGVKKGQSVLEVRAICHLTGVNVTEITPGLVQLTVDSLGKRVMKVNHKIMGKPVSGITVSKVDVLPKEVTVSGPSERLASIDKLIVPVDVSNRDADFEDETAVVPVNTDGTEMYDLNISPAKVKVKAKILQQLVTKQLPIKVATEGSLPAGLVLVKLEYKPDMLNLTAVPSVLKELPEVKTAPIVLDKVTSNTELDMPLNLPPNVLADVHKVKVVIEVKEAPPAR